MTAYHGLLVIDKPAGCTSRDVVDRILRSFPRRTRIGHTGTLDPLATGVLVLCLGVATRLAEYVQDMRKTYRAGILLGAASDTDDAEGTITPVAGVRQPEQLILAQALQEFVGGIDQVPPAYSAAKVTGRRAYDLARQGEEVTLQSRRVQIYGIDLLRYDFPRLEIEVRCGRGTYIRSLARDLGKKMGCGALIETLRRTRVGPFTVQNALGLDADAGTLQSGLQPISAAVAELPRLTLEAADIHRLRQGQGVKLSEPAKDANHVAVFDTVGDLVAIAASDPVKQMLMPVKVLTS